MANKTPRFCNHPGCSELTTQRYCPKHEAEHKTESKKKEAAYDRTRLTSRQRGYDSQWEKVRKAYLAKHPLCEACEAEGRVMPAVLVHHKKPIADGGDRLNEDNLMSLCTTCHERIHGKDRWNPRRV